MQLRTRVLDDDVRAFAAAGGRQLVLLGAGFDCRAWRLRDALERATVFEVDHPATQRKKREVMANEPTNARVEFVAWDFEDEPLDRLPARLGLVGHDPRAPTMTISEGVLPYLTDEATAATFDGVAGYGAPGSRFSFTYFDRELLADRSRAAARERAAVRLLGEPFRNGFDVARLPSWLAARGYRLSRDESAVDLAGRLYGSHPEAVRVMSDPHRARRHFASATLVGR
jgi:methyltransferase (TIGR00027 family)